MQEICKRNWRGRFHYVNSTQAMSWLWFIADIAARGGMQDSQGFWDCRCAGWTWHANWSARRLCRTRVLDCAEQHSPTFQSICDTVTPNKINTDSEKGALEGKIPCLELIFNFKFPFPYVAGVTNFLDINQLTEILLVDNKTAPPGTCTKSWFYNGNKLPFPQPSWFAGFFLPKPYRCLDEVDGWNGPLGLCGKGNIAQNKWTDQRVNSLNIKHTDIFVLYVWCSEY